MNPESQIEKQIDEIKEQLKASPDDPSLIHDLGVGFFLLGKYSNAIIQLKKATALDKTSALYRFNLGNAYAENDQPQLAVNAYLDALDIDPDHIPTLNNLADCYEQLGDPEKSIELFRYLVKADPENALSHFNLGNFYLRQNQHIEAVRCYKEAITRDQTFVDAYFNIAWVLQQIKAYSDALEYAEQGLDKDPSHEELARLKKELLSVAGSAT